MKRTKRVSRAAKRIDYSVTVLTEPRYFAVQFQPQLIKTAAHHLERLNFTPFFPHIEIRKSKKTTTIEPMFRGYGFVRLDLLTDLWAEINRTTGVIGLLPRNRAYPRPMPIGMIEHFMLHDPVPEDKFEDVMRGYLHNQPPVVQSPEPDYVSGITKVEIADSHRWLYGRKGTYLSRIGSLFQIVVYVDHANTGNPVWVDEDDVLISC